MTVRRQYDEKALLPSYVHSHAATEIEREQEREEEQQQQQATAGAEKRCKSCPVNFGEMCYCASGMRKEPRPERANQI